MTNAPEERELVHGTCVALDGIGLLLRGRPGIGKSDLALRLIDEGAALVADDLVQISRRDGRLLARLPDEAPPQARGRLEVRGIGILPVRSLPGTQIHLVAELKPQAEIERLPRPGQWICLGLQVPAVEIDPGTPSAAAKLRLVARAGPGFIMPPP